MCSPSRRATCGCEMQHWLLRSVHVHYVHTFSGSRSYGRASFAVTGAAVVAGAALPASACV